MLSEWFEDNNANLEKINRIRIQVVGVDPLERLVCSVLDPKGDEDQHGHDGWLSRLHHAACTDTCVQS
jgi:hypothetical protein